MTATPRTLAAATRLLEEHADLTSRIALVEEDRAERIAQANAWADSAGQPMQARLDAIEAAIEPWWRANGAAIAKGKKSAELGGCIIGLRMSRPKLAHGFESDDKATEALRSTRWARQTTRIKLFTRPHVYPEAAAARRQGGRGSFVARLLDRAGRALLRGPIGMRIGDFPIVETLVDVRATLLDWRDKGRVSIEIDGGRMSADFVDAIEPAIKLELRNRIVEVETQLRNYGVTVEQ